MQKLWGGRFESQTDQLIEKLNDSLVFDCRLWPYDIEGSIAHGTMLGTTGVIPEDEAQLIVSALRQIRDDLHKGTLTLPEDAEDVHTAVEGLLRERIGPIAGKLHTARSRNDQVATDVRLYLRDACDQIDARLAEFQTALVKVAENETETVLPGFTHLQHAQPIVLAHQLLAYFWMIDRDRERLADARKRINRCPLGAAALAGTGFPIDRRQVAEALHFDEVLHNSIDAVSDRDFIAEFLAGASILMMHISRLSEEIILWNSPEFGFITLDDAVTTGSSIMPQKKNPDVAELARGKTGRVFGSLVTILTLTKGLPLSYNKDLQEDKEPLFDTVDTLNLVVPAMTKMLSTARFRRSRMLEMTRKDFSTATDLADHLVRLGLPFREAHEVVGRVVRHCVDNELGLEDLTPADLAEFSDLLKATGANELSILSVDSSVRSRNSEGGTAPDAVRIQLQLARTRLQSHSS